MCQSYLVYCIHVFSMQWDSLDGEGQVLEQLLLAIVCQTDFISRNDHVPLLGGLSGCGDQGVRWRAG